MTATLDNDFKDLLNITDSIETKRTITKCLAEIKKYREKIKSYIDANYVDFMPYLLANELYIEEGETLTKEVEYLLQNINNETVTALNDANKGLLQYIDDLQETYIGLQVSMKLLKIDDLFQCLEEVKSNKEFLSVMDIIAQLKSVIDDPTDKAIIRRLECYETIQMKLRVETETMTTNLKKCFERLVQLSEKPFQNTKSVTLKISKDEKMLEDTVMALFNARFNPQQLCKFLLDNCFEPIITKPTSIEFHDDTSPDFIQLSLSYSIKDLGNSLRPNYKDVFQKIEMFITCLGHINIELGDNHVFTIIGDQLKDKLLKLIVNECLMHSIPETMDDLKNSTLVDDVTQFHQLLVDSQLIDNKCDRALMEFTDKFGVLFKNRFCRNIIDSAIEIMHKDLHDMTLMAEKNTAEDVASNPFKFPCCMVSKSSLDLVNLMEKILRQSVNVSDDIATNLLKTISLIINAYLSEVPKHHQKLLQSIPQQSALFYNNCMFLAHWVTKNSDKAIPSFSTLVKSLQSLGLQHFNEQVKSQRAMLIDILKQIDLSNAISELGLNVHKLIRQSLRQFEFLQNVWQSILPEVMYNKTITDILNDFCSELIRRIISMEDISTTVGDELSGIITMILNKVPELFKDKHQVLHIKTWMKLEQLKMILNASLLEITEQWCEGSGILTANYKAEEIKHLIRALFQNTDRRANALSSIV